MGKTNGGKATFENVNSLFKKFIEKYVVQYNFVDGNSIQFHKKGTVLEMLRPIADDLKCVKLFSSLNNKFNKLTQQFFLFLNLYKEINAINLLSEYGKYKKYIANSFICENLFELIIIGFSSFFITSKAYKDEVTVSLVVKCTDEELFSLNKYKIFLHNETHITIANGNFGLENDNDKFAKIISRDFGKIATSVSHFDFREKMKVIKELRDTKIVHTQLDDNEYKYMKNLLIHVEKNFSFIQEIYNLIKSIMTVLYWVYNTKSCDVNFMIKIYKENADIIFNMIKLQDDKK